MRISADLWSTRRWWQNRRPCSERDRRWGEGGRRGLDVVQHLQELVGVGLHQLGVHLAVLQGGGVETDKVIGEGTLGMFVSMYFLRSIVRNSNIK